MTPQEFKTLIHQARGAIQKYVQETLPRQAGKIAVDHFRENFAKGGFVNNGLKIWQKPARFSESGKASARYGTLLSGRNELYNSISHEASPGKVVIQSDKPYSAIHNEGGTITIPVTKASRRFAWAKHYEATEAKNTTEADKWKGMALTSKTSLVVNMPKRQFVGHSHELDTAVIEEAVNFIDKQLK